MAIRPTDQPYYIQALMMGYSWTGTVGAPTTITYSYDFSTWEFGIENKRPLEHSLLVSGPMETLNAIQKSAVDSAFSSWSNVADITFINVGTTEGDNTDIVLRQTNLNFGVIGASIPTSPSNVDTIGDLVETVDVVLDKLSLLAPVGGTNDYTIILHELGHALGLKHPHDMGTDFNPLLSAAEDSYKATVMSYNQGIQLGSPISTMLPVGPMIYDIAALQYLYGANNSYNSGDDTHILDGINSLDGNNYSQNLSFPYDKVGEALWDAGGNDTINSSAFSGDAILDLREGLDFYSSVGFTQVWNAFGSNIENARSGVGNDDLYGNDLDNLLEGGSGDDDYFFYGDNFGIDTITDNNGVNRIFLDDILMMGSALSTQTAGLYYLIVGGVEYAITQVSNWIEIAAKTAVDAVIKITDFTDGDFGIFLVDNSTPSDIAINNLEIDENDTGAVIGDVTVIDPDAGDIHKVIVDDVRFEVVAGQLKLKDGEYIDFEFEDTVTVNLTAMDNGGFSVTKQFTITVNDLNDNNFIIGTGANDVLTGGFGNDTIIGLAGNDTILGGADNDSIFGGAGNDIILGSDGDDFLNGQYQNDIIFGGNGSDTIRGGHGVDLMQGDAGIDTFLFSAVTDSNAAFGVDTIYNFEDGVDLIDVSALGSSGISSFADLTVADDGAVTTITGNSNTFELKLNGVYAIDSSDFVF